MATKKKAGGKKIKKVEPQEEPTIKASFSVEEIRMKKDLHWHLKMLVGKILPKSFHDYTVKMLLDEEPYKNRIEAAAQALAEVKKKSTLFKEYDAEAIQDATEEKEEAEENLKTMQAQCTQIDFLATVEELKYNGGETSLVMQMPDNVVEQINKVKFLLGYYAIELKPFISES